MRVTVAAVGERTGFVSFSCFLGYTDNLGPVLPVTGHRIGLHLRGGD